MKYAIITMGDYMKINKKSLVFSILIGILLSSSIGVMAYSIFANNVKYNPNNTNWKVNNVEAALNDLYSKINNYQSKTSSIKMINFQAAKPYNYTVDDAVVGDYYILVAQWSYVPGDSLTVTGGTIEHTESLGAYPSASRVYTIKCTNSTMSLSFNYNTD